MSSAEVTKHGLSNTLTPVQWGETLSGAPAASLRLKASSPVLVRRWTGICPDIEQPPLDHHYITLHLGGSKRIKRRGEGRERLSIIDEGGYSVTPAGSAFQWRTEGPVDFAHVYLRPSFLDGVIHSEFDRDARFVGLQDALGARDPLMEALVGTLVASLGADRHPTPAYWDGLFHTLACRLLFQHSTVSSAEDPARLGLAPGRVSRVREFVEANLARDIGLKDLAEVGGVSVYHFSRGFRRATGQSPCAFLHHRRIERAKLLLRETGQPQPDIALACGFRSHSRFSTAFKRVTGVGPRRYRLMV